MLKIVSIRFRSNGSIKLMKSSGTIADQTDKLSHKLSGTHQDHRGNKGWRLAKATQILVIVLSSIAFVYFARSILLPLLVAVMASMTLRPLVTWLGKCHLPVSLAAVIVVGFFIAAMGFGVMWLGRPTVEWVQSAPGKIPELKEKYKDVLQPVLRFSDAASKVGNLDASQNSTNEVHQVAVKDNHMVSTMFTRTGSLLAGIGEAIVLTLLLLISGDTFMRKLANMFPTQQHKRRAMEIGSEIQHNISIYLFTVSIINTGLGFCVGLLLWLIGMPNAAMWGGVAALLNFLPFFGPTIGAIAVGLAGLLAFNTVGGALLPVGAYLLLHLLESYLVTPLALGQRFKLNLIVIFVAFMFFAWLWGVVGALLAVPLLVTLKVICERVPALSSVSTVLSV